MFERFRASIVLERQFWRRFWKRFFIGAVLALIIFTVTAGYIRQLVCTIYPTYCRPSKYNATPIVPPPKTSGQKLMPDAHIFSEAALPHEEASSCDLMPI
ncbi:MAG: hypothetical protein A2945_01105 [Candidatus Liptonbacteria bacterium RIFCSPLOWO2_01_FULL_52_25]|uniref:Uncharacterized protein n=1 Tax=Candidatus Liptonbacteria bacterium RIFCSPLOWO2_01_FULL_52_25 TaxID=1798650 RepID=A0A1G2CG95_9BACT|nr:MAG: hypothetical protein A2945_01105 [Candidatus Liptonbacteria bacterium RIFCSPLOWO2_01_FULL_52_25]